MDSKTYFSDNVDVVRLREWFIPQVQEGAEEDLLSAIGSSVRWAVSWKKEDGYVIMQNEASNSSGVYSSSQL